MASMACCQKQSGKDGRMSDKIYIRNLEVFGKHGVLPEENRLGQKFQINAVLYTHTREAGLKDDLTKTIHYGEVSHFMSGFMMEHTPPEVTAKARQSTMDNVLFASIFSQSLAICFIFLPSSK